MMRDDYLNSHVYPVKTEMTFPSLHLFSTDKEESKGIIMLDILLHSCSTDEDESKRIIVNNTL